NGTRLRVNGGPNMADFRRFSQDVQQSLRALLTPGRALRYLVTTQRLRPETIAWLEQQSFRPQGRFNYCASGRTGEETQATIAAMIRETRDDMRPPSFSGRKLAAIKHPGYSEAAGVLAVAGPGATNVALADIGRNLQLLIAELEYFINEGRLPLT